MPGVYIHIPFCVRKCSYCNFFSVSDTSDVEAYVEALIAEMFVRKDYLGNQPIESLYFGGGTPSVLSSKQIERIIAKVEKFFGLAANAEITLEANPNNLSQNYFYELSLTPVNRLSIGIQSFFDEHLQLLGRIHTHAQAENALEWSEKYCFKNLSVDLMYGYPRLELSEWEQNLEKVAQVPHLSCYCLNLEEHSALYHEIERKKWQLPDENTILMQYQTLKSFARKQQYQHYEISNLCRGDTFAIHNTSYWQNKPYIGLGVSAHSFDLYSRQWNLDDIPSYIRAWQSLQISSQYNELEGVVFEKEILTPQMQYNEYLMTSLRTMWGCDLSLLTSRFESAFVDDLYIKLQSIPSGLYTIDEGKLYLTDEGFLMADQIAGKLFV